MFSLDNFYYILYTNLLAPVNITAHYFIPFGSLNPNDLVHHTPLHGSRSHDCLFYDQEPLFDIDLPLMTDYYKSKTLTILANSEHSEIKRQLCKEHNYLDWYYFFHGFAALIWYRDYKYLKQVEHKFTKVFINLNRLTTKDRSYRLFLVSKMLEKDLVKYGDVSLCLDDPSQLHWKKELISKDSNLSKEARKTIYLNLSKLEKPLVVDDHIPQGIASAHCGPAELKLNQNSLFHVVSETIFYYNKLHLTEKIFKPIVSRRPFILVGAPGNLAYLKRYGFKTFDKWIDESYDLEEDNDKRISMIVDQIEKLCKLSKEELNAMYEDMKETLEYNFDYFYGEFRSVIVDEMLENFKNCANQWNNGRVDGRNIDLKKIDFEYVKKILIS